MLKLINVKNLKIIVITLVCLLCCSVVNIQKSNAIEKVNSNLDHVLEYNDNSFAVVNINNSTYEFTPYQLGDWNYTCSNINELNNLIASYNNCKNEYRPNILYIVNSYYKADGSLVNEYNDKSWTIENGNNGLYEFFPAITEDYTIQFDSVEQMNKCVNCYKSILENGNY